MNPLRHHRGAAAEGAGDNLLLYVGVRSSARPPDASHPFGHGKALYFWTLIVSLLIVALGGCASVLEGVWHLVKGEGPEGGVANYVVLGFAALVNGYSWVVARREFRSSRGDRCFWEAAHSTKDPTVVTVLFEDSASLLGVAVAFLALLLGQLLRLPWLDGVASILIGLLMGGVGLWLTYEARGLLLGEGADPALVADVRELVQADPAVEHAADPRTMQLSPEEVLLILDVQFRRGLPAEQMESVIDRLQRSVRDKHPDVKHGYLSAEGLAGGRRAPEGDGRAAGSAPAESAHGGRGA